MDAARFDRLTRALGDGATRRGVLLRLGGAMALAAALPGAGAAGKKGKRRRKPKFNKFGCLDAGKKCNGKDGHCCSGICEGKKRKSRCVAHGELDCTVDDNSCPEPVPCDGGNGRCYRTTGKAAFCGDAGSCDCGPCKKDADCVAEFGEGAACIVCTSYCVDVKGSKKGTACVPVPLV